MLRKYFHAPWRLQDPAQMMRWREKDRPIESERARERERESEREWQRHGDMKSRDTETRRKSERMCEKETRSIQVEEGSLTAWHSDSSEGEVKSLSRLDKLWVICTHNRPAFYLRCELSQKMFGPVVGVVEEGEIDKCWVSLKTKGL